MRCFFCLFFSLFIPLGAAPEFVYLCLTAEDPSQVMAVQWVGGGNGLFLGTEEWLAEEFPIEGSEGKVLKRTILRGLRPDQEYTIKVDGEEYRFKTMPKSLGTVCFVAGGDVYGDYERFRTMNSVVAKLSPNFVVIGGDIAYAFSRKFFSGKIEYQWERWKVFFQCWHEQMRDREGRLIPLVVTTGNHDTKGCYLDLLRGVGRPSLFYTFFPFDELFVPYQKIVVANSLALVLLDSGHTHAISGEQARWLKTTLEESKDVPYKMAAYHVAAYPSLRPFKGRTQALIRNQWSPLFQRYGVQVVFENHDHTYKRTKPQHGVTYLGDGSWAVQPRKVKSFRQRPYLEKSASINAVFFIRLEKDLCQILAIDSQGNTIDEVPVIQPFRSTCKGS